MKVSIVGTGHLGLVTGACFAEVGYEVLFYDENEERTDLLRQGYLSVFEPGLDALFARNLQRGRLQFTSDLADIVAHGEVIFLALPIRSVEDHSGDLSYLFEVVDIIGHYLVRNPELGYRVFVNKSTVPIGTTERVRSSLNALGLVPGHQFSVVSNPGFLRKGRAIADCMEPERIVVGTAGKRAARIMTELYAPFVSMERPILVMDPRSSELTKYVTNSFLASRISLMNEVANLCSQVGANVDLVRMGVGLDSRIGKDCLEPGLGFGGERVRTDVDTLVKIGQEHGFPFQMLRSALDVNEQQTSLLVQRIARYFDDDLTGKRIAVWGLSFKPDTDDVEQAPAHAVIRELLDRGATISAFDPEAAAASRTCFGDAVTYGEDRYSVLEDADALVICTEWTQFRRLDFEKMYALLARPVIFDGRNLFDPRVMAERGFAYYSVGRPYYVPVGDQSIWYTSMKKGVA